MKTIFRTTYYSAVVLLFLLIAIAGLTQTKTFRASVRSMVLDELNTVFHASIAFGELQGNLITGFSIPDLVLQLDGRTILSAERVEARYDPTSLLFNKVTLTRLTVVRPRIHLWRDSGGTWNITGLLAPGDPDSTGTSWAVSVHRIELLEGTFTLTDSTAGMVPDGGQAFDFGHLSLNPFTIRAGATIDPDGVTLAIHTFGFESSQPAFRLEELSGEFEIRERSTAARNVKIRTRESRLTLSASLRGADLSTIEDVADLEHAEVRLDLNVDRLEFSEFKRFLPGPVDFLGRAAAFEVRANGPFGNLTVQTVAVKTPRTYVNINGTIANLHRPDELRLDLAARDNILHPLDVPELVPGLNIPDLARFGVVHCSFNFRGTPEQFRAGVDGSIEAGRFIVQADLDLRHTVPAYACTLATQNFDLAPILNDPSFVSSLNTRTTIVGSGTSPETMTSVTRLQADSSMVAGMPVGNSIIVVDVADRSVRTNVLVQGEPTRIDLHARARFGRQDSVRYEVQGTINSLDLAMVLKDRRYDSDLSFGINAAGDLAYEQADIDVRFLRSTFGQHLFEDKSLKVSYLGSDSTGRVMTIESDPLDLRVDGVFTPWTATAILEHAGTTIAGAIGHRLSTLDSLRTGFHRPRKPFAVKALPLREGISARVSAEFKDVAPLGVFLGEPLYGSAVVAASVEGSPEDLSTTGSAVLKDFLYAGSTLLEVTEADLTFTFDHVKERDLFRSLESDIALNARRLLFDSTLFSDVRFLHHLHEDTSEYTLDAVIDSSIGISLSGTSVFVPNRIDLEMPKVHLRIADHVFENPETIRMQYGKDGVRFQDFILQHEAEEVSFSGILDPAGLSDVRFSVRNFLLNNLQEFSRDPDYVEKVKAFNGVLDGSGVFSGNLRRPEFEVSLRAQGVTIGETVFGQVTGEGGYRNGSASVFLEFRSRPNEPSASPELYVSGTMPLALGADARVESDQTMDLTLHSRGFRLEFIDPFVPVTAGLKGSVTGDVVMRGTLRRPLYEGSLSIQDAEFLFVPLGLRYRLRGNLLPEGRIIRLADLQLMNVPEDRVPALLDGLGSMTLAGSLTLEGVEVRGFDIQANGQLLVMKETARLSGLPFYGNIYMATGNTPLRWNGSPEQSFVTGDLLIKNATMTFPPARDVILERSNLLTVEFIDDTSSTIGMVDDGGRSLAMANGAGPLTRVERAPRANGPGEEDRSFLDNISYNLAVETAGLTQVRFVFNQLTNEELFADLKGRLVFLKDEADARVSGELEVGPRSYYRYFKTLSATGKLLFTGELTNPELNIVATYEGMYQPPDTTEAEKRVVVRLNITGTRDEPKVAMGVDLYDLDGNKLPARPDPQSDAIAFLVGGTFKDDMTQGEQRNLVTTSLLGSIGSSLLSGPLTDLVRSQVGYITSVDVYYYGGGNRSFGESADIRLTGEIGDAVIRLGGRVFEDIGNTNVSIQFPMSSITGSEAWRNLILEIERRSGTFDRFEQRRPSNGVHLLYRISF